MSITVWVAADGETAPRVLGPGPWLVGEEEVTAAPHGVEEVAAEAAVLLPIEMPDALEAALVVPRALAGRICRQGVALESGVHGLEDRDELELGRMRVWVSREGLPQRSVHDPQRDGAEGRCARTLRPLEPGEPVVLCPGTRRRACAAVYSLAAWELELRCHRCGYDPKRANPWQPTLFHERPWHELLQHEACDVR